MIKKFEEYKNLREGVGTDADQSQYMQKRVNAVRAIVEQHQKEIESINGGRLYNLLINTLSGARDYFI